MPDSRVAGAAPLLFLLMPEEPGGDDGRTAEAAGDAIDRPGQLFATDRRRVQERELAPRLGTKRRDRDADEAYGHRCR